MGKLLVRAMVLTKEKGIHYVLRIGTKLLLNGTMSIIGCTYYKAFKSGRTFTFQGQRYNYFYHHYNKTWKGGRTVEVPIIWDIIRNNLENNILEVGNVLSHYYPVNHDVLDKYEEAVGVINQDVVDFQPSKKYDLIVSISTMEHVGYEEIPSDPLKIIPAFENLKNIISPDGRIIVTFPLDYNPVLDRLIRVGEIRFDKEFYLKKISKDNLWKEIDKSEAKNIKYNKPIRGVNGLFIGEIKAQSDKDVNISQ